MPDKTEPDAAELIDAKRREAQDEEAKRLSPQAAPSDEERYTSEGLSMARGRASYLKGQQAAREGHSGWIRDGKYEMRFDPGVMPSPLQLLKQTDGSPVDPENPDWEDAADAFRRKIGRYYKIRSGVPEDAIGKVLGAVGDVIKPPHWARSEESYGLKESDPEGHHMPTNVSRWDETLGWLEQKEFEQREARKRSQ